MNNLGWCMVCRIPLMLDDVKNDGPVRGGRHVAVLECPQCGRQGTLEFGSKEFANHRRIDNEQRQARGAAVSYFRRVLDDIDTVDDIVEFKVSGGGV